MFGFIKRWQLAGKLRAKAKRYGLEVVTDPGVPEQERFSLLRDRDSRVLKSGISLEELDRVLTDDTPMERLRISAMRSDGDYKLPGGGGRA